MDLANSTIFLSLEVYLQLWLKSVEFLIHEVSLKYLYLQTCSQFEEKQIASHLRSHLDKFSVLYEKPLQSKKQRNKDRYIFHTVISL